MRRAVLLLLLTPVFVSDDASAAEPTPVVACRKRICRGRVCRPAPDQTIRATLSTNG